ncbi:NAD(P)/FAD-dependent oxidoreductase [Siphonobacter sp. SORGH_AS_1065]|uniref:FAD-dependent oxidoreductase n=1 Tax=Siphonobacter sp. SORGH_AS_1065 TaxID=3041795 RepID=UPI002789928B|nr:NAD(P)/FAD-dependent oxidoreductase [Siphonobacter sp. SORGH_AS_1065]MDQ1088938.1 2-polyprenyl-6-methoxyphenol hydroxylase-like FAD-dependent oxidoreductase [Siphonobacter sp. SORGH_AS_1065]
MNSIQNKTIAIIGGGPGGLTLARLLQMKGVRVNVYERDENEHVRVQGATLDLHQESGLKALEEAGLTAAFKANYRPGADHMRIIDKNATILMDEAVNDREELFRPEIDRGPLRKILLDSLIPGTVSWDSHFKAMSPEGNGWNLQFHNGATAYTDLVIAADGANSKIRPLITPIRPFYAGITIVEGVVHQSETTIPVLHELLQGGKIFALGDSKTLIVSSKGDGSVVFYTGYKTDEFWYKTSGIDFTNKREVLNWFNTAFADWNPLWTELFEKAESTFIPRPQYCMPPDQQWEALSNVTMLGDAAHLMPPYAGEGVNMAMLDALELAHALTNENFQDTQSALAFYEKNMCRRAGEMAQTTLEQTESMHAPDGLSRMLEMFSQA